MFRRVLTTLAVFGVLSAPVSAATIAGNTGLINIPNADALRTGTIEASAHISDGFSVVGLNLGLIPQVEVGVNLVPAVDKIGFTIKGVLAPESRSVPGIAVGLEDESPYIVLSRSFAGFRGHIGFGGGRFDGPFLGASLVLNPVTVSQKGSVSPVTTLMVEHDSRHLNVGARITFTPQVKVDVALVDMQDAMLGVTFTASMK